MMIWLCTLYVPDQKKVNSAIVYFSVIQSVWFRLLNTIQLSGKKAIHSTGDFPVQFKLNGKENLHIDNHYRISDHNTVDVISLYV